MSIWEYANPKKFLATTAPVLPWVFAAAFGCLLVGLTWGFFLTPNAERFQSTVKIIYLHVPSAMMAINAWVMMLVASLIWQVRRHHVSALAAKAAAPVGLVMTLIALITGAIWGQPMWGTWWAWDPRLTSFLILFLFYLGYIALTNASSEKGSVSRVAAVFGIIGAVNIPIINRSVVWWESQHQKASITLGGSAISDAYLWPLFASAIGFSLIFGAIVLMRMRTALAEIRIEARMRRMAED